MEKIPIEIKTLKRHRNITRNQEHRIFPSINPQNPETFLTPSNTEHRGRPTLADGHRGCQQFLGERSSTPLLSTVPLDTCHHYTVGAHACYACPSFSPEEVGNLTAYRGQNGGMKQEAAEGSWKAKPFLEEQPLLCSR